MEKGGKGERGTPVRRVLSVTGASSGGWLLRRRNSAKNRFKNLELASEAAQTARIFEATQISAA